MATLISTKGKVYINLGNTGKKASIDKLENLRVSHLGQKAWNKGLKGAQVSVRKGKKFPSPTIESRLKMSMAANKRVADGRHHLWKGGITEINNKVRHSFEYRLWRKAVYERDDFTCQKTRQRGGKLVAHHINNFSDFPELRTSISNGITLSQESHKEFHKIYGKKNNTLKQLQEYLITK